MLFDIVPWPKKGFFESWIEPKNPYSAKEQYHRAFLFLLDFSVVMVLDIYRMLHGNQYIFTVKWKYQENFVIFCGTTKVRTIKKSAFLLFKADFYVLEPDPYVISFCNAHTIWRYVCIAESRYFDANQ